MYSSIPNLFLTETLTTSNKPRKACILPMMKKIPNKVLNHSCPVSSQNPKLEMILRMHRAKPVQERFYGIIFPAVLPHLRVPRNHLASFLQMLHPSLGQVTYGLGQCPVLLKFLRTTMKLHKSVPAK